MKETGNILGWLGMAEEKEIIGDAEEHVDETTRTVAFLSDAVKAFIAGDFDARNDAITRVKESERAADKVRSKMEHALSDGLLLPPDREDLMRFARALDKIADSTNSAARLLGLIEETLPEAITKEIAVSTALIVAGMARLHEAIHALSAKRFSEAMSFCAEAEKLEHEADDQKRIMLKAVLRAQLSPTSLLLSYNLAQSLEGITDKIDTCSDLIRLISVKSK